jgi:CheY-like chemotaxis protein
MAAPNKRLNSKVLIVGNNRDALSAMSNLLEKQKFSVSTAQNGWQAFNRLQVDDHISLVVLLDL